MKGTLERTITLELEKQGVQARIPVRQGDALIHRITVKLTCGGKKYVPNGAVVAQVYALLPDGKVVSCDGEIGVSGEVTFIPGAGFFACGGPVLCRLILRGDDGGELYSPAFAFDADVCFAADAPTVPAEEYSRLEELLLRTLAAQKACENVANDLKNGNYSIPLSDSVPPMNGEAAAGKSDKASRADHVHPTDTTRMPAMDGMAYSVEISDTDQVPFYSHSGKSMKRAMWGRIFNLMKEAISIPTKVSELSNDAGYIKDTELDSAVEKTLAKASASGEFDGKDGDTPQKGIDYFTEEDKAELINAVVTALPKYDGGVS